MRDWDGMVPVAADSRGPIARLMLGRSLADCIDSGRDNILQLRLIAALLVIVGHSFPVAHPRSWADDPIRQLLPQTASHLVGLMIFFTISGFLITLSFLRQPKLLRFLKARFLRIWPALAVCVTAWAFVLGPLLTRIPLADYFAVSGVNNPYAYAWGNMSIFHQQAFLPGLFETNPLGHYVNGPLWTIPVETTLYLCVGGAGVLRLLRFPWMTSILIAGFFAVLFGWLLRQGNFHYMTNLRLVIEGFFGAGCIACLLRRYVPISTGLMVVVAIACLIARKSGYETPFTWLAVGYFVLWFSYAPKLPKIPHDLDLSYGTYLWAWPIQQTLVGFGVRDPVWLILSATPIVLTIAAASWLLIEKPALRLKDLRRQRAPALQPA